MKNEILISLLKEDIINTSDKEEFKMLIALENEYAETIKNLNVESDIKKEILILLTKIKNESVKKIVLSTLKEIKENKIQDCIKLIDAMLTKFKAKIENYKNIITLTKDKENIIKPLLTLLNCKELFNKNLFLDAYNTLIIFKDASLETLNSLSTILTNQNLIISKHYIYVIDNIKKIKDHEIIIALTDSFLFKASIISSIFFTFYCEQIFKFNKEQIYLINNIIEFHNNKDFIDKHLLNIISTINIISPEFYGLLQKIINNKRAFSNDNQFTKAIDNIINLNSSLYCDIYYEIITNTKYDSDMELAHNYFFEILDQIDRFDKLIAIKECLMNNSYIYCSHKKFILQSLCKNLNPIHYNSISIEIVLNSNILELPNYENIITLLHSINSEHKIKLINNILSYNLSEEISKEIEYLFTIDNEELIEEYVTLFSDYYIRTDNGDWTMTFNMSKKIKNEIILKYFIKVNRILHQRIDSPSIKEKMLEKISEIKDERIMGYLIESINKYMELEEEKETIDKELYTIINAIITKDNTLTSQFCKIILNPDLIKTKNYTYNIKAVDKINNLEALKIIENIIETVIGQSIIEEIIQITNANLLKRIELLISNLETVKFLNDEKKINTVKKYIENPEDEKHEILSEFLLTTSKYVTNNKTKILKIIFESNSKEEIRKKIETNIMLNRTTKSEIMNELFHQYMFPPTYQLEEIIGSMTKEELIDMLSKIENDTEITGSIEVDKKVGILKFTLDGYMKQNK